MSFWDLFFAFVVGGGICVIGQLLMDIGKLTPAHAMCTFVVIGAILGGFGWYDPLIELAGAGATTPIISFGNSLVQGAIGEFERLGFIGVITGIFEITGAGVSTAIIFSFLASLVCKPKN